MRKLAIVESLGRTVNRVGFKLKKHSPEILVVTGIVGAVSSAVMACKATTKLSDITEEAKGKIDDIHADIENGTQTEEDSKKSDQPVKQKQSKSSPWGLLFDWPIRWYERSRRQLRSCA